MCLKIRENGDWVGSSFGDSVWENSDSKLADKTKRLKKSKRPIKVYKILLKIGNRLLSQYTGSVWEEGKVKVSSRKTLKQPLELTRHETKSFQVNKGLHFYMNKKNAMGDRPCYHPNGEYQVWEVSVKPEDVVAFGKFAIYGLTCNSLVAHKAKLVKRVK